MIDNTEPTGLPEIQAPVLPAAVPGIYLEQFRESVTQEATRAEELWFANEISNEAYADSKDKRDRLLALIDANPKGGSDAGMASEYRRWIDFYHAGGTGAFGFEDFLKQEQATSAEVGS